MGLIKSAREGITLRGFPAGILNRVPETDVPKNEAGAPIGVRDATNVDFVGPEGQPRRRGGTEKVLVLEDGHSFFAVPEFPFALAREADTLIAINAEFATAVLATGLGAGEASYALHNDEVVWTVPGIRTGRIAEGDCRGPAGCQPLLLLQGVGCMRASTKSRSPTPTRRARTAAPRWRPRSC
jgi:hypothetical protein